MIQTIQQYRNIDVPQSVWLSWLERQPVTKRLQVQFPARAHTWVLGLILGLGVDRRQPIDVSLSPFLSLKAMKKMSLGEDKKKKKTEKILMHFFQKF